MTEITLQGRASQVMLKVLCFTLAYTIDTTGGVFFVWTKLGNIPQFLDRIPISAHIRRKHITMENSEATYVLVKETTLIHQTSDTYYILTPQLDFRSIVFFLIVGEKVPRL